MSYQLVQQLQEEAIPVQQSCRLLDVSRSGFYEVQRRSAKPVLYKTSVHLKTAFMASHQSYGSRRMITAMVNQGIQVGRHKVRSLMRKAALKPVWKRKFVHTTDSKHNLPIAANVLDHHDRHIANAWEAIDIASMQLHFARCYRDTVVPELSPMMLMADRISLDMALAGKTTLDDVILERILTLLLIFHLSHPLVDRSLKINGDDWCERMSPAIGHIQTQLSEHENETLSMRRSMHCVLLSYLTVTLLLRHKVSG